MTGNKLQTKAVIDRLVADLGMARPVPSQRRFLWRGVVYCTLFFVPALLLAPTRWDLNDRVMESSFWIETGLWIAVAAVAAVLVYRSSIPGLIRGSEMRWGILPFAIVCGLWAARIPTIGIVPEVASEMDVWRGRCGFIIVAMGLAIGALLLRWARRAAPMHAAMTGVWIALCSGSLGAFAMQVICSHDNALHLLLWHVLPIGVLCGAGVFLGRKYLSWGRQS